MTNEHPEPEAIEAQRRAQPGSGSLANPTYWWYVARAELLRAVFEPLIEPGSTVVDVGSADGPSVGWIDRVAERIPMDIFPAGLRPPGLCASALALPIRDGVLDAVTAFDVVEHFPDDAPVLAEVARALKPGGLFALSVPAYRWAWSSFDERAGHYRRYARPAIRRALERAGFRVERASYAFAATFPFFAADRLRAKLTRRDAQSTREPSLSPRVEAMLLRLSRVDAAMLRRRNVPFGSSVLVAARAPG